MPEAIGMVETVGLTTLIEAADAMSKAAGIALVGWDRVGAGLVTVFCRGDVAAVKASVDAGAQNASKLGQVQSVHVIPRPHEELDAVVPQSAAAGGDRKGIRALGLIETRGATGVIEAADAMSKAASVEVAQMQDIGGGYITAIVTGDVGSASSAVGAGAEAVERIGELVAQHVIPHPHDDVVALFIG